MSNTNEHPAYKKIADKANIRLVCKVTDMTYSYDADPINRMATLRAADAEVFMEIDPTAEKADPMVKQDLEAARQELAETLRKAKERFEQSTGTTITAIETRIVTHYSHGSADRSMLSNVGVTAAYPDNGAKGAVWSAA